MKAGGMRFRLEHLNPAMREQVETKLNGRPAPALAAAMAEPPKTPKFGNRKTELEGRIFDSKKEAAHWLLLRDREHRDEISHLLHQGSVPLVVGGIDICKFEPDFLFEESGRLVAHDTKGYKKGPAYDLFKVKARLFEAIHGTKVEEI